MISPTFSKGDSKEVPPAFLNAIEQTAVSEWLRSSPSLVGYWFIISWHAIGMVLLMGVSIFVSSRVLGVGNGLPLSTLRRLYQLIWFGFWVQVISGLLLLVAYPTKVLTAPAFYIKIACIAYGMVLMVRLEKLLPVTGDAPTSPQMVQLAKWSLVLWLAALTAGRFIAYTYKYATYPL